MGTPRRLTPEERIEARHWLQQLAEAARVVRDAMDPQHGLPAVTDEQWAAQWSAMRKPLDDFTARAARGERAVTASPGAFQDRNG